MSTPTTARPGRIAVRVVPRTEPRAPIGAVGAVEAVGAVGAVGAAVAPATPRYVPVPDGGAAPGAPVPAPRPPTSPRVTATPASPAPASPAAPPTAPPTAPPVPRPGPRPRARRRAPAALLGFVVGLVIELLGVAAMLAVVGWPPGADRATPGSVPAPVLPGRLTAAFPDLTVLGGACTTYPPSADEYVTSTGARPLAVVRCDHGAVVPGGYVYYTEWPTVADAVQWQNDQVRWGPSIDGAVQWRDGGGQLQGPWHTRAAADGTVYATAAYAERPYSFDVVTRSPQDAQRMRAALHLQPATDVPG